MVRFFGPPCILSLLLLLLLLLDEHGMVWYGMVASKMCFS